MGAVPLCIVGVCVANIMPRRLDTIENLLGYDSEMVK